MRSFRLPLVLIVLGLVVVGIVLYQVLPRSATVLVPDSGGTYVEGVVGAPQYLNPLLCESNPADRDLCSLLFTGLTRFDENGEVVPSLAQTWIVADTGITYTFQLRPDAKWDDGVSVTADDVIFTTSLLKDPAFPGRPDLGRLWQSVVVNKIDNWTVEFVLRQPYAPFLDVTTIGLLPRHILSGTVAANLPNIPFNVSPKSNGPWKVVETSHANNRIASMALEPNTYFFGPKPQIARLVLRYYTSSQALFDAFRSGDVDGMANLALENQRQAEQRNDVDIHIARQASYVALLINHRKDSGALALTDKAVRQALMFALDREAIVRNVLEGRGVLAHTPFLPETWAYNPNVKIYSPDLERARQLLTSAGYELRAVAPTNEQVWQKDGEAVAVTILVPDSGLFPQIGEAVAVQWRALGLLVKVLPVRNLSAAFLEPRQFQVALVEVLLDGDPDPYPWWHVNQVTTGQNYSGWENKAASEWLNQARVSTSREQRAALYRQFQDAFAEELPALLLYHPTYRYFTSNRVRNLQIANIMFPSDRLRTFANWTVNQKRVTVAEATAVAK
jgi:peptide/nickel transport system substrate-binding protein